MHNRSTTFRLIHNKSTTSRHVKMLWICCGLNIKSTTNRNSGVWFSTCPQQVEKLYNNSKNCTTNPQQIHRKPTTDPQLFNKSATSRHVKMLWICCGLNIKSTTNRNSGVSLSTCPQQVEKLYNNSKNCTTNPQRIHNKSNKWCLSYSASQGLDSAGLSKVKFFILSRR
jgi:hypothetical protein